MAGSGADSTRHGLITVLVKPRSSRPGLGIVERAPRAAGFDGLVARVRAAASEGAANRECEALLAGALGVPKSAVQIVRGHKGRMKQIAIYGLTTEQAQARLERVCSGGRPRGGESSGG